MYGWSTHSTSVRKSHVQSYSLAGAVQIICFPFAPWPLKAESPAKGSRRDLQRSSGSSDIVIATEGFIYCPEKNKTTASCLFDNRVTSLEFSVPQVTNPFPLVFLQLPTQPSGEGGPAGHPSLAFWCENVAQELSVQLLPGLSPTRLRAQGWQWEARRNRRQPGLSCHSPLAERGPGMVAGLLWNTGS